MDAHELVRELENTQKFFLTTLSCFEPGDAAFAPDPAMYTVAAHVAHVADTVDWFMGGAFGSGWDMEFEAAIARAKRATSLPEAESQLRAAFDRARDVIGSASVEELSAPIPNDVMMNGAPRYGVVGGIVDHTAHHRGALAVYARLLGKVPLMPYA